VPDIVLSVLDRAGVRPELLRCNSMAAEFMLHEPARALGIKVQCYEKLPLLDYITSTMPF
jgi:hypothetical protein